MIINAKKEGKSVWASNYKIKEFNCKNTKS